MEAAIRCPDLNDLRRFAAGNLTDEEARPLEEHLLSCPDCVARMPEVDGKDTFFDALRATPAALADPATATIDTGDDERRSKTLRAQNGEAGRAGPAGRLSCAARDRIGRHGRGV